MAPRKRVERRLMTLTIDGWQGSGKTMLLDVLRAAGWEVGKEWVPAGQEHERVTAKVAPPSRRKAGK